MTEMIRRLDYEPRCKDWLKRRSRLNLETRECSQNIRYLQKREEKLLLQSLARLDLALRLLKNDNKRNVQIVKAFQRKVSTRSVKFDDQAFRDDTCGAIGANGVATVRKRGGRFFRRMTVEDEDDERTQEEKRQLENKIDINSEPKQNVVKCSQSPFSKVHAALELFSIDEIPQNTIEPKPQSEKRPSSSVSFAVGIMSSHSGSNDFSFAQNQPRPMSVTNERPCRDGLTASFSSPIRRRASTPGPRAGQGHGIRSRSFTPSLPAPDVREASPSSQPSQRSVPRPDTITHFDTNIPSSRDHRSMSVGHVSAHPPIRANSCTDMATAAMSVSEENRPVTADVILSKHSYMTSGGSEGRSFKVLRDTYKGIYEEDIHPATKRVIALREGEVVNLAKLQARVKQLCLKLKVFNNV